MNFSSASRRPNLGKLGSYIPFGALLIMATSLFAASGIYSFTLNSIDGKPAPLADYKGKVVLLVNVASQCGYTPQYSALEAIYEKYKDQGFVISGLPGQQFRRAGTRDKRRDQDILHPKVQRDVPHVRKDLGQGRRSGAALRYLTKETGHGDIKWNFTKFLVDRDGKVVQRFEPAVTPDSKEMTTAIEKQLKP